MSTIDSIINDPHYHELFSIIKGVRNAIVYGVKIRFPHAVIMSLLFGKGELVNILFRLRLSIHKKILKLYELV